MLIENWMDTENSKRECFCIAELRARIYMTIQNVLALYDGNWSKKKTLIVTKSVRLN